MQIIDTAISEIKIIEPKVFGDNRGYFMESWNESVFAAAGFDCRWMQDNESKSGYGVLRGLHYQLEPYAQSKLVRVISGKVLDVVVDIRRGSPTFGKHVSVELSGENKRQIYIPRGFAHGFLVLSDTAEFCYKCDDFYHANDEGGIAWNDPKIGIQWPEIIGKYRGTASSDGYAMSDGTRLKLSEKDQKFSAL
jgi:dTDP-4-dehydrorhamnose 3,5-epimerase